MSRRSARILALAAAVVLSPLAARAQDAPPDANVEARQQYNQGTAAYKDKKFVEAALHFEAAAAQRAHAITLYTAALAWEQANKPERAADDFARALDVPGLNAQQATNARDRIASLEKTLGTVVVMAPEGYRVQLEGQTEVAAPARLHGVPGVHKLLVRAPGKAVERRDVTLEVGQFARVEIEEAPAPAPAPPPPPPPPPREAPPPPPPPPREAPPASPDLTTRHAIGFAAIGVGAATLAAGVLLGTQALDARDAYNATPTHATLDHAQALQTWTTVAFVAGGVVAAGGLVLVLLPGGKPKTAALDLRPTLGGLRLGGGF